jgi:diacylglycerol kinase family enzyme
VPFVCVPAGTRNHFARDLGLDPDDPAGALEAFSDGDERRIDVGTVNGRLFLNCVSLGIYGEAVRQAAYRDAKLRTLLETAHAVLGPGGEVPELRLVDDLGVEHRRPAIVLVSNNPYGLRRPARHGARPRLDAGRLGVIVVDAPAGAAPALGWAWHATSLEVGAPATVPAGLDGESIELVPPLEFMIRPGALRVRTPRRGGVRVRRRPRAPGQFH